MPLSQRRRNKIMVANNSEEDVDFNEESDLRDNASEGADNENIGGEEKSSSPAEEGENVDDNASGFHNLFFVRALKKLLLFFIYLNIFIRSIG